MVFKDIIAVHRKKHVRNTDKYILLAKYSFLMIEQDISLVVIQVDAL
jgi:hypothetical protein